MTSSEEAPAKVAYKLFMVFACIPPPNFSKLFTSIQAHELYETKRIKTHLDNVLYISSLQSDLSMYGRSCHSRNTTWFTVSNMYYVLHPINKNMSHSFVQRVSPSPTFIWTAITLGSLAIFSFSFLSATVETLWSSSLEINSFSQL